MDYQKLLDTLLLDAVNLGTKLVSALFLWIVGRFLIKYAIRLMDRILIRKAVDKTVTAFVSSTLLVLLNICLVLAILGFFGFQTTTFAALLAAVGLAIGTAWGGLLANFAAGAFVLILRPFKVGDAVTIAGVSGTVVDIGLFVTTLNTAQNVRTIVGNGRVFQDNMQNFSVNDYRRVDLSAQLDHTVDPNHAIRMLKDKLQQIPNVLKTPAPVVDLMQFTALGPQLAVWVFCVNENYWQVYFDVNRLIRDSFGEAGYPAPEQRVSMRTA